MSKAKTERNAKITQMHKDGAPAKQICEQLGVTPHVVKGVLYRAHHGEPDRRAAKPNPERDAKIRKLHADGKTTNDIADAIGLQRRHTLKLIRRLGLKPHVRGQVDWSSELIAAIKADYDDGMNLEDIAAKHGVWRSTIIRKAKLLGWPMRGRRYTPPKGPRAPRSKSERPEGLVWTALEGSDPQPLIGRPFGSCAWPLDTDSDVPMACCLPVESGGKPYCAAHCAIAYVPTRHKQSVGAYTPRFRLAA